MHFLPNPRVLLGISCLLCVLQCYTAHIAPHHNTYASFTSAPYSHGGQTNHRNTGSFINPWAYGPAPNYDRWPNAGNRIDKNAVPYHDAAPYYHGTSSITHNFWPNGPAPNFRNPTPYRWSHHAIGGFFDNREWTQNGQRLRDSHPLVLNITKMARAIKLTSTCQIQASHPDCVSALHPPYILSVQESLSYTLTKFIETSDVETQLYFVFQNKSNVFYDTEKFFRNYFHSSTRELPGHCSTLKAQVNGQAAQLYEEIGDIFKKSIAKTMMDFPRAHYHFGGHGLMGNLALLVALDIQCGNRQKNFALNPKLNVFMFQPPLLGDSIFARALNYHQIKVTSVLENDDIVTQLPSVPHFQRLGDIVTIQNDAMHLCQQAVGQQCRQPVPFIGDPKNYANYLRRNPQWFSDLKSAHNSFRGQKNFFAQ